MMCLEDMAVRAMDDGMVMRASLYVTTLPCWDLEK